MYYRQDSPSNKKTVRSLKPFGSVKKRMSIVGNPSAVNVSEVFFYYKAVKSISMIYVLHFTAGL